MASPERQEIRMRAIPKVNETSKEKLSKVNEVLLDKTRSGKGLIRERAGKRKNEVVRGSSRGVAQAEA